MRSVCSRGDCYDHTKVRSVCSQDDCYDHTQMRSACSQSDGYDRTQMRSVCSQGDCYDPDQIMSLVVKVVAMIIPIYDVGLQTTLLLCTRTGDVINSQGR